MLAFLAPRDDAELLGLKVRPLEEGRVLYVAADRPNQGRRSLLRMVDEETAAELDRRAMVWPRPLPFDLRDKPERLASWVRDEAGAAMAFFDSLSALFPDLTETRTGGAIAAALNALAADGVQSVLSVHTRKRGRDERRTRPRIDDVFGSRIITTACGSVVLLDGEPGDPVVRLRHLKQPAAEVGPFDVLIDHERGTMERAGGRPARRPARREGRAQRLRGRSSAGGRTRRGGRRLSGRSPASPSRASSAAARAVTVLARTSDAEEAREVRG